MKSIVLRVSAVALAAMFAACSSGPGGFNESPSPGPDTAAPSVPTGVTATAQSATRVVLSWNASTDPGAGVAGYRVYRDGSTTALATATATNYTDTTVVANTAYSYTVSAYDRAAPANESAPSAAATVTTPAPAPPPAGGLDERPANTSCLAGDPPGSSLSLAVQRVFAGLGNFDQPIAMLQEPASNARWYVVQKSGSSRVFDNTASVSTTRAFANLSGRLNSAPNSPSDERGLLGMAFHPDWPANPRVYLFYTGTHSTLGLVDRVSEFRSTDGGNTLAPDTELVLLEVDDPEGNHNGGNIAFGPDGMLYIGIGDGGGAGDQHGATGNGQDLTTLLGKMLRINVSGASQATPYTIPPTNPFAANPRCTGGHGDERCPEIYAYGFRNPWRWSFDRVSGELWLNDVGQSALEEVDRVVLGGNYGWRCFEGTNPFNAACGSNPDPIPPVAQYGRSRGFSTTGGHVYRGSAIPALVGRYVFGDYGGALWSIPRDTAPTLTLGAGLSTGLQIVSFGQDQAGEIYVVSLGGSTNSGTLHRIVQGVGAGHQIPSQLSETGCVSAADPAQPASGLIPLDPLAQFFSDGAQ
jgi:glucose/arabinose dehydrogenase